MKKFYKIWSKDCPFIFDTRNLTTPYSLSYDYVFHTPDGWVMHDKDLGDITNLWGLICLPCWCAISIDSYICGKPNINRLYRFPVQNKNFLAEYKPSDFDLTKLHDIVVMPNKPGISALQIDTMKDVKKSDKLLIKNLAKSDNARRAHFLIHAQMYLFNYRDPYLRKMIAKKFPQYVKYTDELDDYKYSE